MKKQGRLLKNLDRRAKIADWRRKKIRKKRGPTPLYEKIWTTGVVAGIVTNVFLEQYHVAEALAWIGLVSTVVFAGIDWYRGRYRGKQSFYFSLGGLALLPAFLLALSVGSYFSIFGMLPGQIATDAYLKEHRTEIERNVDHFVSLHASADLRAPDPDDLMPFTHMPPILSSAIFRLPLLAKSWNGELTEEDAKRYVFWHLQDVAETWATLPRRMTQEEIDAEAAHPAKPQGATHPYISGLLCLETRDGRIIVDPFFGAIPSNDKDRADFVPFIEEEKHLNPDYLGVIEAPFPIYGFDAASLDFMAPLADVCRAMKPTAPNDH